MNIRLHITRLGSFRSTSAVHTTGSPGFRHLQVPNPLLICTKIIRRFSSIPKASRPSAGSKPILQFRDIYFRLLSVYRPFQAQNLHNRSTATLLKFQDLGRWVSGVFSVHRHLQVLDLHFSFGTHRYTRGSQGFIGILRWYCQPGLAAPPGV